MTREAFSSEPGGRYVAIVDDRTRYGKYNGHGSRNTCSHFGIEDRIWGIFVHALLEQCSSSWCAADLYLYSPEDIQ